MNFEGIRTLVTGGAGFIGSHLVDELVRKGAEVRVVDNLSRGKLENLEQCRDKIEFVKGDLTEKDIAESVLKDIDFCFHLAAVVGGVEYMASHPAEFLKTMLMNYNIIEACRKIDVERLLYTSSACAYPVHLQESVDQAPLKEEDALKYGAMPDSDYGWAKLLGEVQCQSYHRAYGMKISIVRPFNPYGPRESFDPKDSHVIPSLIRKAVFREHPFVVWGSGQQIRAFTYISDIVEGIILGIEKVPDADPVNLGSSEYTTIRELAELILKLTNYNTNIVWDKTKPEGVKVRRSDMSKAFRLLGWEPKISLEEGVKKTIDWYLEQISKGGNVNAQPKVKN
jgi:nucleoside-diphosphate-sugar epimerase